MDTGSFTDKLLLRQPELQPCAEDIAKLGSLMLATIKAGGTILSCGNGGSAADADHIAGELMKGFLLTRPLDRKARELAALAGSMLQPALDKFADMDSGSNAVNATAPVAAWAARLQMPVRAVSLCSNQALLTAIMNDQGPELVFAQQILGLCKPGDLLVCLSTSGKSPNIVAAAALAKAIGARTAALTGSAAGPLAACCDVVIKVPGADAGQIQDLHRPVYHALCAYVENSLFGQDTSCVQG
jgi:D-sedoheptulose 7-phosphate isomerase